MPALHQALQNNSLPPAISHYLTESVQPDLFDRGIDLDQEVRLAALIQQHSTLPQSAVAGLWLFAGNLSLSHAISQELKTNTGSFWHGIMHRRERDFWNAKYWFQRIGDHPTLDRISQWIIESMPESLSAGLVAKHGRFSPPHFVDLCEALDPRDQETRKELSEIAWLEWQALFLHSIVT